MNRSDQVIWGTPPVRHIGCGTSIPRDYGIVDAGTVEGAVGSTEWDNEFSNDDRTSRVSRLEDGST